MVILTADPNTGELTQKVVSADEINAVVKQNEVDSQEPSQEDVEQFHIVEGEIDVLGVKQVMLPSDIITAISEIEPYHFSISSKNFDLPLSVI